MADPTLPESGPMLVIDTASVRSAAAIYDMGSMRVLSASDEIVGRGHAEILTRQVGEALAGAGIAYRDLARVAVTVGPGSFTGIRVGISAARGIALALAIPAVGVDVLEALAFGWRHQGGPVLAVQDARRDELFAALYAADGAVLAAPAAIAASAAAGLAAQAGDGILHLAGSGGDIVAAAMPGRAFIRHDPEGLPPLSTIGAIGAVRRPGEPVRPLYLRGADAKPQQRPAGIVRSGLPSA